VILQRRPTDFAHRNLFLQAMLGIHAWGDVLERLVDRHGQVTTPEAGYQPPEDAVLGVLGALVLLRKIRDIEGLRGEVPPVDSPAPADLRGLFR